MSVIFADGFDHYTSLSQKWSDTFSASISSAGRMNSNGLSLSMGFSYVLKDLTTQYATLIVGMALKVAAGSSGGILRWETVSGGHYQARLDVNADGSLSIYKGDGTTLIGTSVARIRFGAWCYLEARITIGSSGNFTLRINEQTYLDLSGVDTQGYASLSYTDRVRICVNGAGTGTMQVDDVYFSNTSGSANNNFLGDVRIETLFPTGAGASTDWTPINAAANWQAVDEGGSPNDETDWVESATATDKDLYAYSDLASTAGSIPAVQLPIRARQDTVGTNQIKGVARTSATEAQSAAITLADTYATYPAVMELNPATAAAWTVAELNGSEFGIYSEAVA